MYLYDTSALGGMESENETDDASTSTLPIRHESFLQSLSEIVSLFFHYYNISNILRNCHDISNNHYKGVMLLQDKK